MPDSAPMNAPMVFRVSTHIISSLRRLTYAVVVVAGLLLMIGAVVRSFDRGPSKSAPFAAALPIPETTPPAPVPDRGSFFAGEQVGPGETMFASTPIVVNFGVSPEKNAWLGLLSQAKSFDAFPGGTMEERIDGVVRVFEFPAMGVT
ncbi:MAG: hypothetical protein KDN22_25820 [Verrucomicrobiae bacterium]|nr:hypothetical protein [Verrucomicrobiae bacterium]